MRGDEERQEGFIVLTSLEDREPTDHSLRAQLVQILFAIPSERRLCEHLEYNLLLRWFVGLPLSEAVWHPGTGIPDRSSLLPGSFFASLTGGLPLMASFSAAC